MNGQESSTNQQKSMNWGRVVSAGIYGGLGGLFIYLGGDDVFYLNLEPESYQFYRFRWCLSASCFGFAVLGLHLIRHESSVWPLHLFYYPFILAVISALVFSALHLFDASSGFVFYYLAPGLCFIFAFRADRFWRYVQALIERGSRLMR